nr:Flp family type IVb pilin [Arthrobacter ruber]
MSNTRMHLLPRLVRKEDGATAVEYGIMVAFLAVAIIVAVTFLSGGLSTTFNKVACQVQGKTYAAAASGGQGTCS